MQEKTKSFWINGVTNQSPHPVTMSFSTKENIWYRKDKKSNPEKTKFLLQKGHNTAILEKKRQYVMAQADMFRFRMKTKNIKMREELGNEEQET